jgi:hypothetical protein
MDQDATRPYEVRATRPTLPDGKANGTRQSPLSVEGTFAGRNRQLIHDVTHDLTGLNETLSANSVIRALHGRKERSLCLVDGSGVANYVWVADPFICSVITYSAWSRNYLMKIFHEVGVV